jgi:hypothetical protein
MKIRNLFAALLFVSLAALILISSLRKPYNNWDMIGYIASAKSFETNDIDLLHQFTYDQLRNSVPAAAYEELVKGKFRNAISTDVTAFSEQLPFYQIRPLYNFTVYMLYKAGVNIVSATHIVSGSFMVLVIVLLYFMSRSFLRESLVYAVPLLALIFGALDLGILSTPDAMAAFGIILISYSFLKERYNLVIILLPVITGIRTDLILFSIPILLFMFLLKISDRWKVMISMIAALLIYKGIETYFGYPGWSTIFYFSLVEQLTHPISSPPTLTLKQYGYAMNTAILVMQRDKAFILYLLITAYSFYLMVTSNPGRQSTNSSGIKNCTWCVLQFACSIFVLIHFLAFPVTWERFFFAPYMVSAVILLIQISGMLKGDTAELGIAAKD